MNNNSPVRPTWISRLFNPPRPRWRASQRTGPPARFRPWLEALEDRLAPALITLTGTDVTHDETAGLQNGTETPTPAGDADDDDVLFSSIPGAFLTRLSALTSATPIGAAESPGNVVTFTPTGTLGNIALTDANGDPLDGDDSGLDTTDGEDILLYTDTNDSIVLGKTASGTLVFAIYLEETGGTPPTGGKLWTVQYEAIDHGDDGNDHDSSVDLTGLVHVTANESQTFSFANAPSGQNLFMMFGTTSQAILVTGEDPANESAGQNVSNDGDTVNTGQGGGATTLGTEGQQVKAQKALVVTFVSGANSNFLVPNLSPTEANDESNIAFSGYVLTRGAELTISQMTPGSSSTTATVELAAYLTADGTGDNYIDNNPLVQGDTAINIDSVQVIRGGVNVVGTQGVSVDLSGLTAVITGVKDDDIIRYTTSADHNRVLIRNDQPASGSGSNVSFDLGGFTLTQVAGDTEEVGSKIFFEDDGPAIDLTPTTATIAVDESVGTGGSSKDEPGNAPPNDETTPGAPLGAIGYAVTTAATLFTETADAGSDGQASKVYELVLTAGATGLTDTASDSAVKLVDNNGVIEGRTDDADAFLVFTIAVDADSGDVTTTQYRALDHGDDGNDHDSSVSMLSGLVELQATLTDGDTDFASDKIELGSRIGFEDDGPDAVVENATAAEIVLDESPLAPDGDGVNSATADFSVNFAAPADHGSDGAGSVSYALVLDGTDVPSGLYALDATDTLDVGDDGDGIGQGAEILLNQSGNTITGSAGGTDYFTIEVDPATGEVTFTRLANIWHGDTADHDDPETLTLADPSDLRLEQTVTDADGDSDSAAIDLGAGVFTIEDDGLDVTPRPEGAPLLTVDESDLGTPASTSFAGNFEEAFGTDGQGGAPVSFALSTPGGDSGLVDTDTGEAVVLSVNAGVVEGRTQTTDLLVFTVSVAADGDVTLEQQRAVVHPVTPDPDDSVFLTSATLVTLTKTVTDGDGDTDSAVLNIGLLLEFRDDGPAIAVGDSSGNFIDGAQGVWTQDPGSDGLKSLGVTLDSYAIDGVAGTGVTSFTKTGDFTFEGSITDDFNDDGTSETVEFTLTFDPLDGSYDLQLTTPPTTVVTFDTSQGQLKAGGPDAVQTLLFGGNPPTEAGNDDIVFFGVVATAPIQGAPPPPTTNDIEDLVVEGATDLTEAQIEAQLPLAGLITPGTQMNVSTSGIGVNNNNLNGANEGPGTGAFAGTTITSGDESFVVNPETVVDKVTVFIDNSVGGYTPATEDLYYTVYYTDGTVSAPTDVTNPLAVPPLDPNNEFPDALQGHGQYFVIDGGDKQIDAVQLTMGRGTIKIPVIQFTVEQAFDPQPLDLNFTATLSDGDSDTQQDTFAVHLDPAEALRADSIGGGEGVESLSEQSLRSVVAEAIAHWRAGGIDARAFTALDSLDVRVRDLRGNLLGLASGHTIWIDQDAAGHGWSFGSAPGRMDLLHVVEHELGHVLGLKHNDGGVMSAFLSAGAIDAGAAATPATARAAAPVAPASSPAALVPDSARFEAAPPTSLTTAAAPTARSSDIAAAFVVAPSAPPAAFTVGVGGSAPAAVLPPDGAFLAAASPNGSQGQAPYALRPRPAESVAAIDSLFGGTAQRRSGEAPLALSAEALPAAGGHLPTIMSERPLGDEVVPLSEWIDRIFIEEGVTVEQPGEPGGTGLSVVGAALLGVGGLLSAQRPARLDGARRNVRGEQPRFRPRPI